MSSCGSLYDDELTQALINSIVNFSSAEFFSSPNGELAQIVPVGVFSGGEFIQQSSPYNAYEQFGYSDEIVDGQVPFCGYQQQQQQTQTKREPLPQDFMTYGGGYCFQEIKQEPKFEMTGGFTQLVPIGYSSTAPQQSNQQVASFATAPSERATSVDRLNQMVVIQALDVQSVCKVLNIPPEPMFWNKEQTHAWLIWNCQQFHLPALDLSKFDIEGFRLSMLNEAEFEKLAPGCGDVLWSLLDAWREASMPVKSEVDLGGYGCPSQSISQSPLSTPEYISPSISQKPFNFGSCAGSPASQSHFDNAYSQYSVMSMATHSPAGSSGTDSGFDTEDVSEDDPCNEDNEMDSTGGSHTPLYRFLGETLDKPHLYGGAIRWLDRSKGIFKIEDSARVARLWGKRKNRPAMNYDKMSRSIRQYYKKGIMKKTERSQRLVYQFCPAYIP